jgi:hypothetical protein
MINIDFRRAEPRDYPAILTLQSTNYIENLSEEQRQTGFMSAQFTAEQTARIAEDLGTTVAEVNDRIGGFLCAIRPDFDTGSPVIAAMLGAYDRLFFQGSPLSAYTSYIYGPVCIAAQYRGRGLLRGLYNAQKRELAGRYEAGVAFVSRDNPHSLSAHVHGLGMTVVGEFALNRKTYVALAFHL